MLQKTNTTINPYFYCTRQTYDVQDRCKYLKVMVQPLILSLSDRAVKYVQILIQVDEFVKRSKRNILQNHKSEMTLEDVEQAIGKQKQSTIGLHERYREGKISKEGYILQKKQVTMKIEELNYKRLKIINGMGDKREQDYE